MTGSPEHPTPKDFLTLVDLITRLLGEMEKRLSTKLDENSALAKDRWERHEKEHQQYMDLIETRFNEVESTLEEHVKVASRRWELEDDEELILEARVRPIKAGFTLLARNWRTLLLAILAILAIIGVSSDALLNLMSPQ